MRLRDRSVLESGSVDRGVDFDRKDLTLHERKNNFGSNDARRVRVCFGHNRGPFRLTRGLPVQRGGSAADQIRALLQNGPLPSGRDPGSATGCRRQDDPKGVETGEGYDHWLLAEGRQQGVDIASVNIMVSPWEGEGSEPSPSRDKPQHPTPG